MKCIRCHSRIARGAWFCTNCGVQVAPGQFRPPRNRGLTVVYGIVALVVIAPVLLIGGGIATLCYSQDAQSSKQAQQGRSVLSTLKIHGEQADKIQTQHNGCNEGGVTSGWATATYGYSAPSLSAAHRAVAAALGTPAEPTWDTVDYGQDKPVTLSEASQQAAQKTVLASGIREYITGADGRNYTVEYFFDKQVTVCNQTNPYLKDCSLESIITDDGLLALPVARVTVQT